MYGDNYTVNCPSTGGGSVDFVPLTGTGGSPSNNANG